MSAADLEKRLLQTVTDISTLPFVVRKLMVTLSDPRTSAKDLGKVIVSDQALSVKVLRLVNSAYYGFANEITNINHAVAALGYDSLRSLVLSIASHSAFFKNDTGAFFNRKNLWLHSLGTAICSKILAQYLKFPNPEDFFAAGLIHDVGKVIMDQYTPALFHKVLMNAIHQKITFYESEKILLGLTHPEIGQAVAKKWCFSSFLVDAIKFHHDPSLAGDSWQATSIIHFSNYLCKIKKIGDNGDQTPPLIDPVVQKAIKINETAMDLIFVEVEKELKNCQSFIDMN